MLARDAGGWAEEQAQAFPLPWPGRARSPPRPWLGRPASLRRGDAGCGPQASAAMERMGLNAAVGVNLSLFGFFGLGQLILLYEMCKWSLYWSCSSSCRNRALNATVGPARGCNCGRVGLLFFADPVLPLVPFLSFSLPLSVGCAKATV